MCDYLNPEQNYKFVKQSTIGVIVKVLSLFKKNAHGGGIIVHWLNTITSLSEDLVSALYDID